MGRPRITGTGVAGPASSTGLWDNPLLRHLALIMTVKLLLLTALWWLFFRPPTGAAPPANDIHTHIAGPAAKPHTPFIE